LRYQTDAPGEFVGCLTRKDKVDELRRRSRQPRRGSISWVCHPEPSHSTNMSSMAQNEISFGNQNLGLQVGQSSAPINANIHLPPGKLYSAGQSSTMLTTGSTQIGQKHHRRPPPTSLSAATLISSTVERFLISYIKDVLYQQRGLLWSAWAGLGT
jgi:hypothetical protein